MSWSHFSQVLFLKLHLAKDGSWHCCSHSVLLCSPCLSETQVGWVPFHEHLYLSLCGSGCGWQVASQAAVLTHPMSEPSSHLSQVPLGLHFERDCLVHSWSQASLTWVHDGSSLPGVHSLHYPVPGSHLPCGLPQVAAQKAAVLQSLSSREHLSHFWVSKLHLAFWISFEHTSWQDRASGN